eukprot:14671755-Alexandrium_andersonii.AAC.1
MEKLDPQQPGDGGFWEAIDEMAGMVSDGGRRGKVLAEIPERLAKKLGVRSLRPGTRARPGKRGEGLC